MEFAWPICPRCQETVTADEDQMLDDGVVAHRVCFDRRNRMGARRLLLLSVEKETIRVVPRHHFGILPPAA